MNPIYDFKGRRPWSPVPPKAWGCYGAHVHPLRALVTTPQESPALTKGDEPQAYSSGPWRAALASSAMPRAPR
jgi:hypothetical protein